MKSNVVSPVECLRYAMHLPVSVVITGLDSQQILEQALEAARTFQPMSADEITTLIGKTADIAAAGAYELFKTTALFDSTGKHPEWLGEETEQVRQLATGSIT